MKFCKNDKKRDHKETATTAIMNELSTPGSQNVKWKLRMVR